MLRQEHHQIATGVCLTEDLEDLLAPLPLDVSPCVADLLYFFPADAVLDLNLVEDMWVDVDGVYAWQQRSFSAVAV